MFGDPGAALRGEFPPSYCEPLSKGLLQTLLLAIFLKKKSFGTEDYPADPVG